MKNRMKKKIALFISLVMVITLVVIPGDVKAYTISGNTITLDSYETMTVDTASANDYEVPSGAELTVAEGVSITGKVTLNGGKLTVKSGASVLSISMDYGANLYIESGGSVGSIDANGGSIYNSGKITGNVTTIADITNYETGSIEGTVTVGTNTYVTNMGTMGTVSATFSYDLVNKGSISSLTLEFSGVENSGSIDSLTVISDSPVVNNAGATIGTLDVTYSSVENNGTIETLSYNTSSGSCNLTLGGSSSTGTLNLPNVGEGYYVKITATAGAAIGAADIYADSLDTASSGGISVNNSIKLSGTSSIPSGLGISVGASTTITTGAAYSDLCVSCNGDKYLLPNQTFSGKTIADMYDFNVDATQIDIPELKVGYVDTDIKEAAKTFNISNTGLGDMKCKITSIPDFVELYNGETALATNATLSISNDAPKAITIKLKTGKPVSEYSGNIVLQKWTEFNSASVTDVNTGSVSIPVTAKVIKKSGEASVSVSDINYGGVISPVVESTTNGTTAVTYKYKEKGAEDSTYSETAPTAAGEYTIQATFATTEEYNEVIATADFKILRNAGTATVTVADVYYGNAPSPVVASATNGTENVTYKYKAKNAPDIAYTATVPTVVGEYTIQATFAQTESYNAVTVTADFAILRITGTATVTVADVYYGNTPSPVASSATNGTDSVTYKYKVKGAADSTYTTTVPTAAGEYTVQATFAQTEVYNEVTATDDFAILRNAGTGTVTVADVYYGNTPSPVVSSATNGTDSVTYKYKVKGKADSTYTETVPTAVGEYTIQATLAPTDNFGEVIATSNFKISYLPVPEDAYIISGEQGKNDYYTSEVTITPAQGYLIANSLDGTYKESITISKSLDAFDVYLKNVSTGEKTTGVKIKAIKIDTEAPIILNAVDGDKLYGNQVEIRVQDDNLTQVLVNDVEMKIKDGVAILELSSNNGEESYSISCSDAAGNVRNIKLVVAENWMKDKTIPSGLLVKLVKDYSYKLGDGNWQVKGDETSYSGNITFYVNKDGEYTFSKID